jgi:hypothetical protein
MNGSTASRSIEDLHAAPVSPTSGRWGQTRRAVRSASRVFATILVVSSTSLSNAREVSPSRSIDGIPPGARLEQHEVRQTIEAEVWGWGEEISTELAFPRFDTLNGSRQLLEMRFSYNFHANWMGHWLASPYDVPTFATVRVWIGQDFFPFTNEILHIPPGVGSLSAYGGLRPPFAPEAFQPLFAGWAVGYDFDDDGNFVPDFSTAVVVDDPSPFIGPDEVVSQTRWFADEPEMTEELAGPPPPPNSIYTPELLEAELEDASMSFAVHYVYLAQDAVFADGFDGASP